MQVTPLSARISWGFVDKCRDKPAVALKEMPTKCHRYTGRFICSETHGLGWLGFWVFHCLPHSAWAYENVAEEAGQLGNMVEHPNTSQPNPVLRAYESPCSESTIPCMASSKNFTFFHHKRFKTTSENFWQTLLTSWHLGLCSVARAKDAAEFTRS